MKIIKIPCHIEKYVSKKKCPCCGEMYEVQEDNNPIIHYCDEVLKVSVFQSCKKCRNSWYENYYYSTELQDMDIQLMA